MRKWISFAVALVLSTAFASNAWSRETIIAENVLGPEGPLVVNGKLYYVAWNPGSLSRWDGKSSTVINNAPGCSHNGLALIKQKTLLLACSDPHGAILELDLDGKE